MRLRTVPAAEQRDLALAMRPYLAELAHFEGQPDDPATLEYPYLPLYWTQQEREAYWIEDRDARVGFALINRDVFLPDSAWSVSEFYVTPAFRRRGLGKEAARVLLGRHPGAWEVAILPGNARALAFWTNVLEGLSAGRVASFAPGTVADWDGHLLVADGSAPPS
jgi:predicted acetyltransferase